MIEWWQTALISWGGSTIVGVLAIVIYVRTANDNRAAEALRAKWKVEEEDRESDRQIRRERVQAERKKEEEKRESDRQSRRERVKPISDFLDLAKQYFARATIEKVVDATYAGRPDKNDGMTLERWRDRVRDLFPKGFLSDLEDLQLLKAVSIAVATVSTEEIQAQLMDVYAGLKPPEAPLKQLEYTAAIQAAETMVEQYVTGIEPAETPAEAKE